MAWLLKQSVELLAPFLCRTFNWSLENGIVPSIFKSAYITPLLKKADLDPAEPKSFRPISNMSVISKLLERLVSKQLLRYFKDNDMLPVLQSAYRAHHSTDTAILRVLSDILSALDSGNLVMLTLLDLSAAFDCVDHHTLLQRLRTSYGLGEQVVNWFTSFLSGRTQQVRTATSSSMPSAVDFGFPQGSVLGPTLFSSTLPTCCSSSKVIISRHTRMQTTHRFMDTVSRQTLAVSLSVSLSASARLQRG